MSPAATATAGGRTGAPTLVIEPPRAPEVDLRALWAHREVLYFLVWRDLKLRYRQTAVGALWVILQPLLPLAVLSVVFSSFAATPTDGVAYTPLVLAGLLPWLYVSQTIGTAATSLVADQSILTRVYFPRLLVPVSRVIRGLVDHVLALVVMVAVLAIWYPPGPARLLGLVAGLALAAGVTLAIGIALAPVNARYRDIGNAIPFLTQVWMFASPVVYSTSVVHDEYRLLYALNPMVAVIEIYRAAMLGVTPDANVIAVGVAVTLATLAAAVVVFAKAEPTLADRL